MISKRMEIKDGVDENQDKSGIIRRKKEAWNETRVDELPDNKCFSRILLPLKISAAVFGMFFMQRSNNGIQQSLSIRRRVLNTFCSTILYNITLCVTFTLNVFRHILAFWVRNTKEDVAFRIISGCWLVMGAVNVVLMIKSSHYKFGHFNMLIKRLDEKISQLFQESDIVYPKEKLKKRVYTILIGTWILIGITSITMVIVYFVTITPVLESMRMLFISPFAASNIITMATFCVQILNSIAWGLPVAYSVIMCLTIKYAFKEMSNSFKVLVINNDYVLTDECSKYRHIHLELCKCVNILDKDFTYVFANWYIINIPQSCFISYILLNRNMDPISVGLLLFWLVTGITIVLITSGFAASLHEAVSLIFIAPACSRVRYRRPIFPSVSPSVCQHLCRRSTFMSKLVF